MSSLKSAESVANYISTRATSSISDATLARFIGRNQLVDMEKIEPWETAVTFGDPVVVQAHGLNWFAVYNGSYALIGGELAKTHNWLINKQRVPWRQFHSFGIGLVLAPGQLPVPLFNVIMNYHDRVCSG
jgi:hypothetical protein